MVGVAAWARPSGEGMLQLGVLWNAPFKLASLLRVDPG